MISVALVEPEIPPNTGNIARLCAAARVPLHIVGVTGFRMDDKAVRRAGLDYWSEVILQVIQVSNALTHSYPKLASSTLQPRVIRAMPIGSSALRIALFSVAKREVLPEQVLRDNSDRCLTIPMLNPNVRSLNLATAVGIVLFEALRQTGVLRTPLNSPE